MQWQLEPATPNEFTLTRLSRSAGHGSGSVGTLRCAASQGTAKRNDLDQPKAEDGLGKGRTGTGTGTGRGTGLTSWAGIVQVDVGGNGFVLQSQDGLDDARESCSALGMANVWLDLQRTCIHQHSDLGNEPRMEWQVAQPHIHFPLKCPREDPISGLQHSFPADHQWVLRSIPGQQSRKSSRSSAAQGSFSACLLPVPWHSKNAVLETSAMPAFS